MRKTDRPGVSFLLMKSHVPDNEQACYDRGRINSGFAALLCKAHRGRFSHMSPEEAISFGPFIERANASC
ncbi:MAG: hypothetical protein NVS4B11_12120 [Ktedonobacteraceae bacterium]